MALDKNQRRIVGFDNVERIYTFEPLTVSLAADVEDDLWRAVSALGGSLGESAVMLFAEKGVAGLSSSDMGACMGIPNAVMAAFPRETLKTFASALLSGAVVAGPETHILTDGWSDAYLRGRWPERVEAIVAAIDVSFPSYFSNAQAYLRGLFVSRLGLISLKAKTDISTGGL